MKIAPSDSPSPPGDGTIRYFRHPGVPGVESLSVCRSTRPMTFCVSNFVLAYVIESQSSIHVGRNRFSIVDQSIFVWGPGTPFGLLRIPQPETVKVLFIPSSLVRQVTEEMGQGGHELGNSPHGFQDPMLSKALRLFHGSFERPDASHLEIESRFLQMVRNVMERAVGGRSSRARVSPGTESWAVKQARDLIDERCSEKITLRELAEETGLSRFHLLRSFSQEVGVPPHAYQLHRRIEKAKSLLVAGVPPAHVAADLGFCDQSHFNRCFKSQLGVTPLEYSGRSAPPSAHW